MRIVLKIGDVAITAGAFLRRRRSRAKEHQAHKCQREAHADRPLDQKSAGGQPAVDAKQNESHHRFIPRSRIGP
jgi:hypothetical protein